MQNEQNFVPMVGIDKLHYAKVTSDTTSSYTAETPKPVLGMTEGGFNQNAQSATFYADNGPYEVGAALGDFDIAIACADVTPQMKADLYGYDYDTDTGELSATDINPPSVAIMYRIQKANGAYRYVTIYKAKAVPNEERAQTKGGSINFQANGFSLKGAKRMTDGRLFRTLDDDDPNLPSSVTPEVIAANWFTDAEWEIKAPSAG